MPVAAAPARAAPPVGLHEPFADEIARRRQELVELRQRRHLRVCGLTRRLRSRRGLRLGRCRRAARLWRPWLPAVAAPVWRPDRPAAARRVMTVSSLTVLLRSLRRCVFSGSFSSPASGGLTICRSGIRTGGGWAGAACCAGAGAGAGRAGTLAAGGAAFGAGITSTSSNGGGLGISMCARRMKGSSVSSSPCRSTDTISAHVRRD